MLYSLVRPLLFLLEPEFSHDLTLSTLKVLQTLGAFPQSSFTSSNTIQCFGLNFPNPVGLAAGLDKNGECIRAWGSYGFGFIEVGTVTPKAQSGNVKPRLFRLKKNQALINRMGFNNKGIDYLIENLKKFPMNCPVGANIGKNRDTSLHLAHEDYLHCFQKVYSHADYVTINISSPNTPGLKSLQHGEMLKSIIGPIMIERERQSDKINKSIPIVVKISPDLELDELKAIIDDLISLKVDGVIATNTTVTRDNLLNDKDVKEEGGLSGKPLFQTSTEIVKHIYQHAGDRLPIIAVGGIFSSEDAKAKLAAGAKLVQLYSGMIYRGPGLVKEIISKISA
ncbi:MAG: quinone-dependent dihydroorotate dehydrogenase [Gammaproteobacteria bacterium]|jgi:dihydroorotate dehydrogenase|nr:quinone-dependent dihydroorotate dehydrogenase [Gammaproteobacteria bacterium]